jgi:hypothetical protein
MRSGGRSLALAAGPLVLSLATGCSFLTVRPAPGRPLGATPRASCTTSRLAPAADVSAGAALALVGGLLVVGSTQCDDRSFVCNGGDATRYLAAGLGMAAAGTAYLISATRGFRSTGECREVLAAQRACAGGDGSGCACLRGEVDACAALEKSLAVRAAPAPIQEPSGSCASDSDCTVGICFEGRCRR